MFKRQILPISLGLGLAAFLGFARPAAAQMEEGEGHASVAGLIGYGFKDGANLGFGVRGGYTLPMNVYVGGTFVYHLGKSESTPYGDFSLNVFYVGGEGGYDLNLDPVIVRPFLGLGYASVKLDGPSIFGVDVSASEGKFAAWPGAAVLYPVTEQFFVGGDARFLIVSDVNAFSIFGTAGMDF